VSWPLTPFVLERDNCETPAFIRVPSLTPGNHRARRLVRHSRWDDRTSQSSCPSNQDRIDHDIGPPTDVSSESKVWTVTLLNHLRVASEVRAGVPRQPS